MPTPSPALNRLPRWRTMISPPVTVWPAKTLTPRRLALLSRPLREERGPCLCAIAGASLLGRAPGDLRDLDAGQRLAMARAPPVPAFGLELEHAQLLPALVPDDARLDLDLLEPVRVEDRLVGAEEDRLQPHGVALSALQLLDQQRLPGLDPILLATGLDDCVSHQSEVLSAFARERRRPPRRPRRLAFDGSASSSSLTCGSASTSAAVAAVRPTSSMRTSCLVPTYGNPPMTDTM